MSDTVAVATHRRLSARPDLLALLGSSTGLGPWLWSDNPHTVVEGTGKQAIVLSHAGVWTSPNTHNTAQFPRLRMQYWSDPTRDAQRNVVKQDARAKAWKVYQAARRTLHRPGGVNEMWTPTVQVIGAHELGGLDWVTVTDTDGTGYWEAYYALSVVFGEETE